MKPLEYFQTMRPRNEALLIVVLMRTRNVNGRIDNGPRFVLNYTPYTTFNKAVVALPRAFYHCLVAAVRRRAFRFVAVGVKFTAI